MAAVQGGRLEARSAGPHNLTLEVVDDPWEVGIEHVVALGHEELQWEDVTLLLQERLDCVLGGQWEPTGKEGDSESGLWEVCPYPGPWTQDLHQAGCPPFPQEGRAQAGLPPALGGPPQAAAELTPRALSWPAGTWRSQASPSLLLGLEMAPLGGANPFSLLCPPSLGPQALSRIWKSFITWKMASLAILVRMWMMSSHSWHRSSWEGAPRWAHEWGACSSSGG